MGELSERLISLYTGAERRKRGSKGHDLIGPENERIEVKGRIISNWGDTLQFNFGKHTAAANIAYCVAWNGAPQLGN